MTKAKVLRLDLDDVTLKTLTQSLVWFWFFIWVYYNITETLANICSNMNYIIGHYQNMISVCRFVYKYFSFKICYEESDSVYTCKNMHKLRIPKNEHAS